MTTGTISLQQLKTAAFFRHDFYRTHLHQIDSFLLTPTSPNPLPSFLPLVSKVSCSPRYPTALDGRAGIRPETRARSSAQFSHPSLMVNDIILVTKYFRIVDPGTITLGSAPSSPSVPLAAISISFGHPALWTLKKSCASVLFLIFNHF